MEEANKKDDFKSLFQDKKSRNFTGWVVGITIVLLILFIIINQLLCIKDFGQLGDFFNGIAAPVLSLVTIILLYNSFLVQKEELKATREALEQSAKEMKNSSTIMERSEQNAKLERLESICFKLLEKYETSRDKFLIPSSSPLVDNSKGVFAIRWFFQDIGTDFFEVKELNPIEMLFERISSSNNQNEKAGMIDQLIAEYFNRIKENHFSTSTYYDEIKSLVYKFIAIYKCILHSEIHAEKLDYLKFAINNYLTNEEMFFVKLFINQLNDLSNLRTELEPFGIVSTSVSIYELHLKDS